MLNQIRKIFNIGTLQEKLDVYSKLEQSLSEQLEGVKELGKKHFEVIKSFEDQLGALKNKIEKSTDSQEKEGYFYLKNRINERYNNYFSNYLDEVFKIKQEVDELKKSISSIIKSNPDLIDFEKEEFIKSIIVLTEAYHMGQFKNALPHLTSEAIQKSIYDKIVEKGWDLNLIQKFFIWNKNK
jgi:hypothetical protein